jgi:hypothetical protein
VEEDDSSEEDDASDPTPASSIDISTLIPPGTYTAELCARWTEEIQYISVTKEQFEYWSVPGRTLLLKEIVYDLGDIDWGGLEDVWDEAALGPFPDEDHYAYFGNTFDDYMFQSTDVHIEFDNSFPLKRPRRKNEHSDCFDYGFDLTELLQQTALFQQSPANKHKPPAVPPASDTWLNNQSNKAVYTLCFTQLYKCGASQVTFKVLKQQTVENFLEAMLENSTIEATVAHTAYDGNNFVYNDIVLGCDQVQAEFYGGRHKSSDFAIEMHPPSRQRQAAIQTRVAVLCCIQKYSDAEIVTAAAAAAAADGDGDGDGDSGSGDSRLLNVSVAIKNYYNGGADTWSHILSFL